MISDNIRKLLLCFLRDDVIIASWGISNIDISESKVSFTVNGFKYQGMVEIDYINNTDNYNVKLGGLCIGCFELDEIVKTLDKKIEYSESNYQDNLIKFLSQ